MIDSSPVLVLLGMHRSGTSLTANWLHHCGLHLGDRLLTHDESNPTGHYEDIDFLQLHKDILEDNKTDYTYAGETPLQLSAYHRARAKAMVTYKHQLHHQWGWKEPRTCLFIELYQELLPQAKYIVLVRHPDKVINSLMQRDWTRIRLSLRDHPLKRWYKSYLLIKNRKVRALRYAKAWKYYNEQLLTLVKALPEEGYFLGTTDDVKEHSASIFQRLTAFGFKLENYPISSVLIKRPPLPKENWVLPDALNQELKELYTSLLEFRSIHQV
ncbi:MAG: sulfotransferase [Lewinella sp.]|jgi:hypothetical protein|uniref:sulfotransferase n=1 Tax=Lewinella sp. TaxID=2004506 RepID=UPI003D6C3505